MHSTMTSPTLARKARLKNHLVSAKARLKTHVTLRRVLLLAAASASAFLLLLTLRTLSASHAGSSPPDAAPASPSSVAAVRHDTRRPERGCTKLPPPVAEALVHYATANNATLRQTAAEVAVTARALARRAPCNLLVFGIGQGSALWATINHGGRTVFLEEDAALIAEVGARLPGLGVESHQVAYRTTLDDADELLGLRNSPDCTTSPHGKDPLSPDHFERSSCKLAMRGLPAAFYETEWDVIMLDGPTGWVPEAPGRTGGAIYMAGMVARARRPGNGETDVMVHNVDRTVEDSFSRAFLCERYLKEEVGRLRHFAIPSHREKEAMPFCP